MPLTLLRHFTRHYRQGTADKVLDDNVLPTDVKASVEGEYAEYGNIDASLEELGITTEEETAPDEGVVDDGLTDEERDQQNKKKLALKVRSISSNYMEREVKRAVIGHTKALTKKK